MEGEFLSSCAYFEYHLHHKQSSQYLSFSNYLSPKPSMRSHIYIHRPTNIKRNHTHTCTPNMYKQTSPRIETGPPLMDASSKSSSKNENTSIFLFFFSSEAHPIKKLSVLFSFHQAVKSSSSISSTALSRSNGLIYLIWQQVSTNEKSTSNKRRMNSFPFVFMHNSCTASLCLSLSVSASEIDYFTSDPSCRYYTPKGKQIWFICIPIHKESHTYSVIPCMFHLNPVVIWI